MHRDLGKQGCFEYPGPDIPVVGPNSVPVMASFRVNLPGQGALGQMAGSIGTNGPVTTIGQAASGSTGTAIQPIVISYGAPSSNIGNTGVVPLGSGTTETGPLAINTTGTAGNLSTTGTGVTGNMGTGTTVSSANGVTTVSGPNGVSTVSGNSISKTSAISYAFV